MMNQRYKVKQSCSKEGDNDCKTNHARHLGFYYNGEIYGIAIWKGIIGKLISWKHELAYVGIGVSFYSMSTHIVD